MSTADDHYFLLIAQPDTDVEVQDYGRDQVAATAAYNEREAEFRDDPKIEVVLIGADSLDTVRTTHSHYFVRSAKDLLNQLEHELAGAANGRRRS